MCTVCMGDPQGPQVNVRSLYPEFYINLVCCNETPAVCHEDVCS